ncbi:hypothetical protein PI125_g7437 [Phytophthora idaei]|nr:hypothetical protein PI125_g7437 [Phytophthora idaei]KAG3129479.1 hypothetical protein PI126_g20955 [Phytophthora idaei]
MSSVCVTTAAAAVSASMAVVTAFAKAKYNRSDCSRHYQIIGRDETHFYECRKD